MGKNTGVGFLATDEVPGTIFGIPVVTDGLTEADLEFFRENPEAGGYYSMGDEAEEDQGAAKAGASRGKYPGAWNNPGNMKYTNTVSFAGQNGRAGGKNQFLTFDTPQNGLNAMGSAIGQMVRVKLPERGTPDFTVRNLVSVYAPSSDDNKTGEYIRFVSGRMGVNPDAKLSLSDSATMGRLLDAMVRRDSGHRHADWFTSGEYKAAAEAMNREIGK